MSERETSQTSIERTCSKKLIKTLEKWEKVQTLQKRIFQNAKLDFLVSKQKFQLWIHRIHVIQFALWVAHRVESSSEADAPIAWSDFA